VTSRSFDGREERHKLARPKSDDKRKAILDAALRVFAEHGIADAPTSAISKAAGVSEGSLFTYFKTKNDLMNAVYLHLRMEFSHYLTDFPYRGDARTRLRYIWDKYLELGALQPGRLKVLAQLRASGKLFKENEPPAVAILEVLNASREAAGGELRNAPPEYLVLMVRAQAEATIEYSNANPESRADCREWGFRMLWHGLAGD
jgi:AcrR family transcriptional regulator